MGDLLEKDTRLDDVLALDDTAYNALLKGIYPLSKSKISAYGFCPYQFALRYLKGIKSEPSFKMVIGTRFHHFAEKFFDGIKEVEDWTKLIHEDYSPFEKDMLSWFISMEYARFDIFKNNPEQYQPFIREVDIYNNDVRVHGFVDRVDYIIPELIPYMEGEVSPTAIRKIVKHLDAGKPVLCPVEYKTGDSFNANSMKHELSIYKQCLQGDPRYKDYFVGCGCYINPKLKKIQYLVLERDETTRAKVDAVYKHIQNRVFPRVCTPGKYEACRLCKIEDTFN